MANWKFKGYIEVNQEFLVQGLNIWNYYWHCEDRKVEVIEPKNGGVYFFKQYQIQQGTKKIDFVAGEFSDLKIGLFVKDEVLVEEL